MVSDAALKQARELMDFANGNYPLTVGIPSW